MKTITFVHEGLGNSSYIVDLGTGSALLVDPDRGVKKYLAALDAAGLKPAGIFETHLHADFVSGARELAAQTGAPIFLAAEAESKLPHQPLRGGKVLILEGCEVSVHASPGHTPEHLSYVLRTAAGPPFLFSGGSLIVGGAARTDLISEDDRTTDPSAVPYVARGVLSIAGRDAALPHPRRRIVLLDRRRQ